jgi:trimethylamine:corrinoid methyltransferase-like protein
MEEKKAAPKRKPAKRKPAKRKPAVRKPPTGAELVTTMSGEPEKATITQVKQNIDRAQLSTISETGIRDQEPLVTLHLRRIGAELTDNGGTVHIPSPSLVQEGERVRVEIHREE